MSDFEDSDAFELDLDDGQESFGEDSDAFERDLDDGQEPAIPASAFSPAGLVELLMKNVKISGTATCLHKPGVELLTGYPHLVFAPLQYGPGIRTENNGTPVAAIVDDVAAGLAYEAIAAKHGVTTAHIDDAVRYATKAGYCTESDA
jgi:uncharacterized protein (DUF433 family)